jgi:uncharacterized membrane protein YoaK (UPF0700 family)
MTRTRDLGRTALLCAIGGSADAIAYLRYGAFVGAMTGNTVLLGIDLVQWQPGRALYHACIVVVFLLAVVMTRIALLSRLSVSPLLVVVAAMLGASGLIESEWSAVVSAAALGMQNAAVRNIGGVSINTVFITGNLVGLGSALPEARAPENRNAAVILATTWLAYAAGAVLGAAALHLTNYAMAVPAALALGAAFIERPA